MSLAENILYLLKVPMEPQPEPDGVSCGKYQPEFGIRAIIVACCVGIGLCIVNGIELHQTLGLACLSASVALLIASTAICVFMSLKWMFMAVSTKQFIIAVHPFIVLSIALSVVMNISGQLSATL